MAGESIPVMQPHFVTGTEYMDALAKMGYNVETMSSPLPIMAKIADAGASMLDNVYKQNLNFMEAQGRLSLAKAQTDHLNEETEYNQMTQTTRAKALDLEAQIKEMDLKKQRDTLDSQIAATNQINALQPQIDQQRLANEKLSGQESQQRLDELTRGNQIAKEAADDYPLALGELPTPGDPDYYKKVNDARTHHSAVLLDPKQAARFEGEIKARTDTHERMASTIAQNKDIQEMIRLHETNSLDDATYRNLNQIAADPIARQRVIAEGHVKEANQRVVSLLARFPRDAAGKAALPQIVQQQYNDLDKMETDISGILTTKEGLERVVGGGYLKYFDPNGNLNANLQGDFEALERYFTARDKLAAEKGIATTKVTEESKIEGRGGETKTHKEEREVPTDELHPAGTAAPAAPRTPAQAIGGQSMSMQQLMAVNPQFKDLVHRAARGKRGEDYDAVQRMYNELTRGFQEGGAVTQTGVSDAPGSTDTVPAMLSPGEFVINADAARNIGEPTLDRLNRTGADTAMPPMRPMAGSSIPMLRMPSTPQAQAQQRPVAMSQGHAEQPAPRAELVSPATPSQTPAVTTTVADPKLLAGSPLLRAESYGPESPNATAADMKQTQGAFVSKLQKGHIAVSPDLLGQYPRGSSWDAVDVRGNIVRRGLTVADTSWISPGVPTHNTVELYNDADLGQVRLIPASQGYQTGGLVDPTTMLDVSQGSQDVATLALLAGQSAAAQGMQGGGPVKGGVMPSMASNVATLPEGNPLYGGPTPGTTDRVPVTAPGFQGGGIVEGGELGGRGGGELGGRGTGGELGDPIQQQTRHRRFRPRLPGQQRLTGPTIPDEMQRKLAKLSQDYLSGLSGLIRSRPEIGPQLLRHARNQIASNLGSPDEEERMQQQQQPAMPSEGQQFSPAQYAMTAQMGEEA